MSDPVAAHALAGRDTFRTRLAEFIAHPSIGADPAFSEGMEGARRFLERRLAAAGFTGIDRLAAPDGSGQLPALYTLSGALLIVISALIVTRGEARPPGSA